MTLPRKFPILDSHQHFYRYDSAEYGWITPEMAAIRRDFLPPDFKDSTTQLGVVGSIAVQARQSLIETHWLLQLAAENDWIRGVVGWVPLIEGQAVAAKLQALQMTSPKLRGVRHVLQAESEAFFDEPGFNRGLQCVTDAGLNYDLLVTEPQLDATLRLVERHPEQRFVVDHLAKPIIAGAPSTKWKRGISGLAAHHHVWCKISGLVTEVPGRRWTPELLQPYLDHVLQSFGADRVMFGSDWPVCLVASEYERWLNFVEHCLNGLSPSQRENVLSGNAARFYLARPRVD